MNARTPATVYDPLSRSLHWLTALAVLGAFVLGPEHFGRQMRDGLDPATRWDIVAHETLGAAVFALTLVRLLWAVVRPAAPRIDMPRWMHGLSKAVQGLLWLLMLALPLTALLALASEHHPLTLLGGLRVNEMPAIADSALASLADWGEVHGLLGDVMIWLAGLHAAAAVYHHVARRDGVLATMLPMLRR